MIHVDDLSIAYHGHPLFTSAEFTIQDGERCGLVGRNGSGKSTLLRLLIGKETPDSGSIVTRKNYLIGMLDQHIVFSQSTILEEAALGLPKGEEDNLYKVEAILFGLGFKEEEMALSPSLLSGGYHLRLHLAKVLVAEPNCLLLDEPTNYLDIVSTRWLTKFLQKWKGEFILITHDREFMDSVTTHTMGIHRGKIRKVRGSTIDFFEQMVQEEEIYERTRQNIEKKRSHAQSYIERFGAKASKASQAQSRQKMLQRIPVLEKLKELHRLDFKFNEAPFFGKKMLEIQQISFDYTDNFKHPLISNLSLSLEKGDRVAIIGKNGRGKSTILRLLARELSPHTGFVKWSDNVHLGYFGQTNIDRLHPQHTVEEEIALANSTLTKTEVKGICGLMMFSDVIADKVTSVLSGGEKSRVLLGKILAAPCNVLMLDEPTHHLDMESIEALIDALEDFQGAVILVTHSELILKRLALDKIIVCHQGQQEMFLGNYQDFLDKNGWHDNESMPAKKKSTDQRHVIKQQRAESVTARSKAIKPLDQKITHIEKMISELESEQQKSCTELIEKSQSGHGVAIQELSKAIALRKTKLDELYEELDHVVQEREKLLSEK